MIEEVIRLSIHVADFLLGICELPENWMLNNVNLCEFRFEVDNNKFNFYNSSEDLYFSFVYYLWNKISSNLFFKPLGRCRTSNFDLCARSYWAVDG